MLGNRNCRHIFSWLILSLYTELFSILSFTIDSSVLMTLIPTFKLVSGGDAVCKKQQQATVVKQVAENEPPRTPNRQSLRENCQGWTVRVISKLAERGIVPDKWRYL